MMHNSLLIADRLRQANEDKISRDRRDPHRNVVPLDSCNVIGREELRLDGEWEIRIEADFPGMEEAAADLADYLDRSGIRVTDRSPRTIVLRSDAPLDAGSFRREVDTDRIVVSASDIGGIWAGIVYLEKELSTRGAPAIRRGKIDRSPAWDVQIGQAPYGANYLVPDLDEEFLSDDAFRLMIHYGVTGMTLYGDWLFYVSSSIFPELNHPDYIHSIQVLKRAAARAKKYGVSLYFVPVSPKLDGHHPLFERVPSARGAKISPGLKENGKSIYNLCSSDPQSLAFHAETMAGLFREVPDLGGLILIIGGESYYHCFMRPDLTDIESDARTNCKRCQVKRPEEAVNALLQATADAVHKVKPDAPVMAWPYSAFVWSSDPTQLELLSGMAPGVALLNTIEKDEWVKKDGYRKLIWDYSVDYTGPASNLIQQAEIVRRKDIPLYIKTETAIGLECIHIPYLPSLGRLADKWRQTANMKPTGVLQSWMFFGMWGSRAEELGWWASWFPNQSTEETIRLMAQRDFGSDAPAYIRAWSELGEAAARLPYIPQYFTGPEFIGPAHPLIFGDEPENKETYEALLYYLQENEETFSTVVNKVKHSLVLVSMPYRHMESVMKSEDGRELSEILITEYSIACTHARRAFEEVAHLALLADPQLAAIATEERLLIEFVYRTLQTALHTYRFLLAKERGEEAEMTRIAILEEDNTRAAARLLNEAPWLDLSRRNDGNFPSSLTMIEAKLTSLNKARKRLEGSA
ncbi:hypothetical protein RB620_09805 [Paenibacillus sp. LHD-117]|uniref:hypothetical protein n=1 Tax=Paenibacillus sp. LHD-117 TaxID=3071412 RepID=UPI0027E20D76|nr:hypothetical protein [Paenibacillus sp. LHD-117]MDQ6419723.1 hypothetical protein [Paenibacillus sp. LHD-117]